MEKTSEEKCLYDIEKLLHKSKGRISPQDATAETGYSIEEVKDALNRLIEIYECRVTVNEQTGNLLYIYRYPLFRRGRKTFREILFVVLEAFWKVFTVVYKASIGIILILYTVIFVILLIILAVGTRDSDRDIDIGSIIGGILRAIAEAFWFASITRPIEYDIEPNGIRYKKYTPEKNKGKSFIHSVYSFVFGPEMPKYNPLADAQEVVAFIRQNKGKLTAGHLILLSGLSYNQAEEKLAEYAVKFKGDLYIAEDGTVVAEFYDILHSASKEFTGGKIEYYMDEADHPYLITGNSSGKNAAIICANAFNLIMSFVGYQFGMAFFGDFGGFVIGTFPLVFSILFFIIPLLRIPFVIDKQNKREKSIIRKKLFGTIVKTKPILSVNELWSKSGLNPEAGNKATQVLEKLVPELQGSIELSPEGIPLYQFQRLYRELQN
jgi:hypothetical protein